MSHTLPETPEKQFREVYKRELDAVFRFCLLRTSDKDVATDFTQDVFFRFWKALNDNQIIKNTRGFLFVIARNIIIDGYRKKKTLSLDSILEDGHVDKNRVAQAHEVIESEAEVSQLIKQIDLLEDPYRQAVYMRYVEGKKPQEIAQILNESPNVISIRITRGTEKLRGVLGYKK
ncbi:MAG: sigma-70 family RNA polymerase sigma factor [bacterium]|nr:sigma-70 family RNA polymerase sigma factor [bacterium]